MGLWEETKLRSPLPAKRLGCMPLQTAGGELLQATVGDPYAGVSACGGVRAGGPYRWWIGDGEFVEAAAGDVQISGASEAPAGGRRPRGPPRRIWRRLAVVVFGQAAVTSEPLPAAKPFPQISAAFGRVTEKRRVYPIEMTKLPLITISSFSQIARLKTIPRRNPPFQAR